MSRVISSKNHTRSPGETALATESGLVPFRGLRLLLQVDRLPLAAHSKGSTWPRPVVGHKRWGGAKSG